MNKKKEKEDLLKKREEIKSILNVLQFSIFKNFLTINKKTPKTGLTMTFFITMGYLLQFRGTFVELSRKINTTMGKYRYRAFQNNRNFEIGLKPYNV